MAEAPEQLKSRYEYRCLAQGSASVIGLHALLRSQRNHRPLSDQRLLLRYERSVTSDLADRYQCNTH